MSRTDAHLAETGKFRELILHIARVSEGDPAFGAVKLNKLLFVSDFQCFLATGRSITGQEYQKLESGPAPRQVLAVLEHMQQQGTVAMAERDYFGHVQKRPFALRDPDLSLFTGREIAIVDCAVQTYYRLNASQMSAISHEFAGLSAVEIGETIGN